MTATRSSTPYHLHFRARIAVLDGRLVPLPWSFTSPLSGMPLAHLEFLCA